MKENIKIKKEWKWCVWSVFAVGILAHFFKFINYLPTADSLYNVWSTQNGSKSARPFLQWACSLSSYTDLPLIEGMLALVYITLTTIVIVELFDIKEKLTIFLIGGILVSFPVVTSTMAYLYTADGYMLAMLLATIAVYVGIERHNIIIGSIALCASLGIYQAYLSFSLILFCVYFIYAILKQKYTDKELNIQILRQIALIILGSGLYFIAYKTAIKLQNMEITSYQGMNTVSFDIHRLKSATFQSVAYVKDFLFQGGRLYNLLHLLMVLMFVAVIIYIVVTEKIYTKIWQMICIGICMVAIIPAACIWKYTSDNCSYHSLMVMGLALVFISTVILWDSFLYSKKYIKLFLAVVCGGLIWKYILIANQAYMLMELTWEREYSKAIMMAESIREVKADSANIIIVGTGDTERSDRRITAEMPYLMGITDVNYFNDESHIVLFLNQYLGLNYSSMDKKQRDEVIGNAEIESMPTWPQKGSVVLYNTDTIIVKLSEE